MKTKLLALTIAIALAASQSASAAVQTWTVGNGTWTTGANGFNGTESWTANNTATFAGTDGTYTVTIGANATTGNGNATVGGLNFTSGNYTFSAASPRTITLGNGTPLGYLRISAGKAMTIGSNVTVAKSTGTTGLTILGGGLVEVATGGTLSNTGGASEVAGGSTLWINGGTATYGSSLVVGQLTTSPASGLNGTLTVDAGALNISTNNLNVGRSNGDVSVATLNGGNITIAAGNLNFGATATSTSEFNLNGGTLSMRQSTSVNTTSTFNFNGGTLKASTGGNSTVYGAFMAGITTANVRNGGANIDSNGQSITIGQSLTHSVVGGDNAIDGGLTKAGLGALSLSGANTYTGGTFVNQGALAYLNQAAIPATGATTVASGAAVTLGILSGNASYFETTDVDALFDTGMLGNITVSTTGSAGIDTTASGNISYTYGNATTRGFAKTGANTLTLTGSNAYSGPTSIYGGTLQISSAASIGDSSATNSIFLGSGTLQSPSGNYSLGTNRSVLLTGTGGIQVDSDTLTVEGAVSGTGSLTKTGAGTLTLAGTNTNSGSVTISAGTLKAGFSNAGALTLADVAGVSYDLNGSNATFTTLTTGTGANNTVTTTGAGSGTDSLTISAFGNDGTGTLFTDNGTRKLALSFTSNGVGAYKATTNPLNTYSGGLTLGTDMRIKPLTASSTNGTSGNITSGPFGRGVITLNGVTAGHGSQIYFDGTNLTLVNDVVVNSNAGNGSRVGSIRVSYPGSAITGNITANALSAVFGADGAVGTSILLTGHLTGASGFTFNHSSGSNAWTATMNNTVSTNDYAGTTTVGSANTTLKLGADNQIPNGTGKGNVSLTGKLDLNGFSESINGLTGAGTVDNVSAGTTNTLTLGDGDASGTTFSGAIKNTTGTLSVTKIGAGSQTLTGPNTYTGPTTVTAGTLIVSGGGTINATTSITVSTGATLTNDTVVAITPALALGEGSTLSGTGNFNPTAMTLTGNLADGFTPIAVGSALTKAGSLTFTLSGVVDGSYSLFTGTPAASFTSVNVGGTPLTFDGGDSLWKGNVGGFDYAFSDSLNTLTVIPEPKTWALIGLGLGFTLFRFSARARRLKSLSGRA